MNKLPCLCPSCQNILSVKSLFCEKCTTEVNGLFPLPIWSQLSDEEQRFLIRFVLSSGSLKEMSKELGLSYPTVRNKLDEIIQKMKYYENEQNTNQNI